MTAYVWHYTVGVHAKKILAEGVIRPALDAGSRQRQSVTWFSSSPDYEPTARKLWREPGKQERQLSVDECATLAGGLYRFAVPIGAALKWRACCAAAGIPQSERIALEAMGRKQGGNPAHWYGVLGAVLLEDVAAVERFENGEWRHHG